MSEAIEFGDARLPERFWRQVAVDPETSCWLWLASVYAKRGGYGQSWHDGAPMAAHRVAYLATVGPVPDDLTLDHLCNVPRCVNPAHLEPVTRAENTRRNNAPNQIRHREGKCANGHPFAEHATYRADGRVSHCRVCRRAKWSVAAADPEFRARRAAAERARRSA